MKVSKRIITFFLALAMIFSLIVAVPVTASASSSGTSSGFASEYITDTDSVEAWKNWYDLNCYNIFGSIISTFVGNALFEQFDSTFSKVGVGRAYALDTLTNCKSKWNLYFVSSVGSTLTALASGFETSGISAEVAYDSVYAVYRLRDTSTKLWLVNSAGHFPYYAPDSADDGTTTISPTGQWINTQKVGSQSVLWHVVSYYELNEFREEWLSTYSCTIVDAGNYYWLVRTNYTASFVLCDKYGMPYYLPKDNQSALTTDKNYYTGVGDSYVDDSTTNNYYDYGTNDYSSTDNSTNVSVYDNGAALIGSPIDINNGIINVGGEVQYIDNLTYDASTQTYYVSSHTNYTYDTTNNYYTTNNNYYFYQYHINYTSITYIGQTEEYDKRYEYYYELPDGRSSADLTAEDLEQLSLVFADVVNYARSSDDLNLRALYHFDGNTEDSSYWSYCSSFDWNTGASLTYMDEGTFNGSLYLDETEHDFTIYLPNESDLIGDFTVQFRFYQSYTPTPVKDSYVAFGSEKVFVFDGVTLYSGWGAALASMPVGQWNEICISRKDGVRYFYLNGVLLYSGTNRISYYGSITFHFGSEQQTYKKIDELRVTRAAVYSVDDYTPTSVPFDSNLALILPDGEYPVADETIIFTPASATFNKLAPVRLTDWTDSSVLGNLTSFSSSSLSYLNWSSSFGNGISLLYNPDYTSLVYDDVSDSVHLSTVSSDVYGSYTSSSATYGAFVQFSYLANGLLLPINNAYTDSYVYCFCVLLSNGMFSYIVFTAYESKPVIVNSVCNCEFVKLSLSQFDLSYSDALSAGSDVKYGISVLPVLPDGVDIVYMELSVSIKPRFTYEFDGAVYSSGELEDFPVLAVRTNQEITSYQIGGVRPSYPTKGLVYALVENGYITSLQIYTGTAWEEVDGRIWTGVRWVPLNYYNVLTLQDLYDSVGGSGDDYEYIYSESGFWAWFQKQWNSFMDKLDFIIEKLGISSGSDCEHVYTTEIQREATCAEPGHMLSTCDNCGDSYTELIEPAGHDWIVQDHVDEVLDEEGNVVEEGYDILVCSVCELETKDYGDGPVENDLFDAIGDLIADGVDWILEKLALVADSLSGITDTFNSFIARIEGMTGDYTLMFGAFLTLLPEDLRILMWLAIIAGVVGLVWSAWTK